MKDRLRRIGRRRTVAWLLTLVTAGAVVGVVAVRQASAWVVVPTGARIAVARNSDGRMALFATASNGAVNYRTQATPGGAAWTPWTVLDGNLTTVAAETNADGRIELFGLNSGGSIYYRAQTAANAATFTPWTLMDGNLVSIAVARSGDGRLQLVGTNVYGSTYQSQQTAANAATFTPWTLMDGGLESVALETNADGRVELFGANGGGPVWHRVQTSVGASTWTAWTAFDGPPATVSAARAADGTLRVFAVVNSATVYYRVQATANADVWSGWKFFDGGDMTQVAVDTNADGRVQLVGIDSRGDFYQRSQAAPGSFNWSGWAYLDRPVAPGGTWLSDCVGVRCPNGIVPVPALPDNVRQVVTGKDSVDATSIDTSAPDVDHHRKSLNVDQVQGVSPFQAALLTDGTVQTWGSNAGGQLGDGTTTDRATPAAVSGLSGVTQIAAGFESMLALRSDGTVWAWGSPYSLVVRYPITLRQVQGLTGIVQIASGEDLGLALRSDGTLWSWNFSDGYGYTPTERPDTPVQVAGLDRVTQIAAGYHHALALREDHTVWAWGYTRYGQAGARTTTGFHTEVNMVPAKVQNLPPVYRIAAGYDENLAIAGDDHAVWGWGGSFEETGPADEDDQDDVFPNTHVPIGDYGSYIYPNGVAYALGLVTPPKRLNLVSAVDISSNFLNDGAVLADGTVWAWRNGHLGDPVQQTGSGITGVTQVAIGTGGLHQKPTLMIAAPFLVVPNVYSRSASSASAVLQSYGFTPEVGGTVVTDDPETDNRVVVQSPGAGTVAARGTVVHLSLGHYVRNGCGPVSC